MFGGSCTSARANAVFMRSPWLKPSVRRSSRLPNSSSCASARRARAPRRRHAMQPRVVDDVLARRQPRVQAARIRQHAHARQRLLRPRGDIDAVDADAAAVGLEQCSHHAQRGGLAGAVGAEQGGDARRRWRESSRRAPPPPPGLAPASGHKALVQLRRPRSSWARCVRQRHEHPGPRHRRRAVGIHFQRLVVVRRIDEALHCVAQARQRHHAVAGVRHHVWRAFGPSARATRSPWRGGVAGSSPPDSSQVGSRRRGVV